MKERLCCGFSRAKWRAKARNLALPSLQYSVVSFCRLPFSFRFHTCSRTETSLSESLSLSLSLSLWPPHFSGPHPIFCGGQLNLRLEGRKGTDRQKGLFISAETRGNEKRMILLQNFLTKRPPSLRARSSSSLCRLRPKRFK